MSTAPRPPAPGPGVLAVGAGLLLFAARGATLRHGACDAPFLDQWLVEADQVLGPWLEGRLAWTDFLAPHHEHYPVGTRLLAWVQASLFRCWDPVVQGLINAALFGGFVAVLAAWFARNLPKPVALVAIGLVAVVHGLPHGWENAIWGLQSAVPLCLLFSFWHIHGSLAHAPGTARWWLAQLAALGALGSFGSGWAAPLAAAAMAAWTAPRDWRRWLAPALLALLGVALLAFALRRQPSEGALALHAPDFTRFLGGWVMQAGWPSTRAFAAAVLFLPSLLFLSALRGRREAGPFDQTVLALGLFGLGQAAAIALGRSASYVGFVPRYADFLAVGVLCNGLVLWRLGAARLVPRAVVALLALVWCGTLAEGLAEINRTGHTLYFKQHAEAWRWHRESALREHLATGDPRHLETETARTYLYPEPATLRRLLALPGFVDLLPASLRGTGPARAGDAAGLAARAIGANLGFFAWSGGLLLLLGLLLPCVRAAGARLADRRDPLRPALAGSIAALAGGAAFLWPDPLVRNAETRLIRLVSKDSPVPDFAFRIVTPTPYPPDNLTGGAALWPEHFRNRFFGTHIDGPAFTGRAESTRFLLTSTALVVPFAGFPATPGNALSLEVLDADDGAVTVLRYQGPNPLQVGFWGLDIGPHQGRVGRLVIEDGRADGRESWVAAAPPLQVPQDISAQLAARWEAERTSGAALSLGILSIAALIVALASVRRDRTA